VLGYAASTNGARRDKMAEIAPKEAIQRARQALGLSPSVTGEALRVDRLDRPATAYYLVLLTPDERQRHIAVVDARTGALDQHAALTGSAAHLTVSMKEALAAVGLGADASARLVWRPSRASRSPLYPVWEISSESDRRYVDQQGQVWDVLPPTGRGGGP
jgi:hypothetical protein